MKRNEAFPSKYLAKGDLETPVKAIIETVEMETIKSDSGDESKAVMSFRGDELKPMILNNTNWLEIESAYGEDTDDWSGNVVELYVDPSIMFGSKRVGGVRVRIPKSAATPAAAPAPAGIVWTWEQAQAEAAKEAITKEMLVAALKAKGFTAYNPARDTATIQAMVEESRNSMPF